MIPKRNCSYFFKARNQGFQNREINTVRECNLEEVVRDIDKAARLLACDYRRTSGHILSEDDLKCALYNKLSYFYSYPCPTLDNGISATALHTEIPWYDEKDKLRWRPDLSIVDPRNLSILHGIGAHRHRNGVSYNRLPSKGFEFSGRAVAVELKFVRTLKGISRRNISSFQKDIDKLDSLCSRYNNRDPEDPYIKGILIVFSKTGKGTEQMRGFIDKNSALKDIKIFFHHADIVSVLPRGNQAR